MQILTLFNSGFALQNGKMKKYLSFFRINFIGALQYRAAALGGLATQYAWGFMYLLMFQAFYRSNPSAIPMPYDQLVSYIWLNQAFLVLFLSYRYDQSIVNSITQGGIAYDMVRPVNLYGMWLCKDLASRCAGALLRCAPVLLLAAVLPEPFGMHLPASIEAFTLFLLSMLLGTLNTASFVILQYITIFYTLSPAGIRYIWLALAELLSGGLIPLTFFPDGIRQVVELLPFASMQNVPLRIYSGNLSGDAALQAVLLQIFWAAFMTCGGIFLMNRATRRVVVQGG